MVQITNIHGIALPIAVWLIHDEYDYDPDKKTISATALMKPTRPTVLASRIPHEERTLDVADLLASSYGTALHDSIEQAWRKGGKEALKKLGVPAKVADSLLINPTPEQLRENPGALVAWIEVRNHRMVDGYKITGKFDMILDGRLFDHKSTSVYAYLLGSKDEDYALQGGIYRWINPDIVLDDEIHINFLFTDWQKSQVKQNPNYPPLRAMEYPVTMLPIPKVEQWVRAKLRELERCWNLPQDQLPECTPKELWQSDPQYKYYANPEYARLGKRSTKNFTTLIDAQNFQKEMGGKGVIITIEGEPKACGYCPAFDICEQRKRYFPDD